MICEAWLARVQEGGEERERTLFSIASERIVSCLSLVSCALVSVGRDACLAATTNSRQLSSRRGTRSNAPA